MRENLIAISLMLILALFVADLIFRGALSQTTHDGLTNLSYPLFLLRSEIEEFFSKSVVELKVSLFSQPADVLSIVSDDQLGFYVLGLERRGVVIDPVSRQLVGFVERVGPVGYVTKWWESEFPVTIVASTTTVVGYYKKLRVEVPENMSELRGRVYVADTERYGRLLRKHDISIGDFEVGVFKPRLERLSGYVIVLDDYEVSREAGKTESGGN